MNVHKKFELSDKQFEAWEYLNDSTSNIILYGGQAYSGKSFLACFWLITNCLQYTNTRWALCRKSLTDLKKTSLNTFKETAEKFFNLKENKNYKINHQTNTINFYNFETKKFDGAEILLLNLDFRPSDTEAHFLGGYEFTGAVIDELPQITKEYFSTLYTRLRYNIEENGLTAKLLCTCNPTVGWVKYHFYERFKKNQLPNDTKFVSTVGDKLFFRKKSYENTLKGFSERDLKRLEYGDWEYANSIDQLFNSNKLEQIFTGLKYSENVTHYITADIARLGEDSTVIMVWEGLKVIRVYKLLKSLIDETAQFIINIMQEFKVPRNNVICDSDGVGGGVVDIIRCVGFVNNSKPKNDEKYDMLKSQCYFKLSTIDWSIDRSIDEEIRNSIRRELEAIRNKSDDFKYRINTKDEQKRLLGNSPDFADSLMMRMYFLYLIEDKVIEIW